MDRGRRLQAAASFLREFPGKSVVRGYARWFGVDLGCALLELQMLGVHIDAAYVDRIREAMREKERRGRERGEQRRRARAEADPCCECDTLVEWCDIPVEWIDEIPF